MKLISPLKPSGTCERLWRAFNRHYTLWGTILVLKCPLTVCRSDPRRFPSLAANGRGQGNWRFNLRKSNTEPLLRLNVESIGSEDLLIEQTVRISENWRISEVAEKRSFVGKRNSFHVLNVVNPPSLPLSKPISLVEFVYFF